MTRVFHIGILAPLFYYLNNYNREKNTFIMNVMIGCMVGIQSLFTILESYSTDSNQEEISNTTKVNFSQLLEKTNKFH